MGIRSILYPGTSTAAGLLPAAADVLNAIGRALISSNLLYTALVWVEKVAPSLPNPIFAAATLAISHFAIVLYLQFIGTPPKAVVVPRTGTPVQYVSE